MDVETPEAIGQLSGRIDALERSMRGDMGQLRGEMGQLRDELRSEMGQLRDGLREEFRAGLAENRRHADVQFEAIRDDIKTIAAGLATISTDLAEHRRYTGSLFAAIRDDMRLLTRKVAAVNAKLDSRQS